MGHLNIITKKTSKVNQIGDAFLFFGKLVNQSVLNILGYQGMRPVTRSTSIGTFPIGQFLLMILNPTN